MRRCLEGYWAPNAGYITGYHYFYLNYCPIKRLVEKDVWDYKRGKMVHRQTTEKTFPSFWDYDHFYFSAFDECVENGKFMAVIKARRRGYSYKGASILCRGYYFMPGFIGLVVAGNKEELDSDGFITKAWDYMDFIDEHTPWTKKRQKIDTKMHRRASLVTTDEKGHKIEIGYKSEIMGIPIGSNFNKVRGKRVDIVFYEEAGKQGLLKETWRVLTPSVSQDGVIFGTQVAFGTANSGDEAFNGLRDIFYNPEG
jgi:heme-degrading monooxygenase HmoA